MRKAVRGHGWLCQTDPAQKVKNPLCSRALVQRAVHQQNLVNLRTDPAAGVKRGCGVLWDKGDLAATNMGEGRIRLPHHRQAVQPHRTAHVLQTLSHHAHQR